MALIPILPEDIKVSSIKVHPTQNFHSSSAGVNGEVFLFAERSSTIKTISSDLQEYQYDVMTTLISEVSSSYFDGQHTTADWSSNIPVLKFPGARKNKHDIQGVVGNYLNNVSRLAGSVDNDKKLTVYRFDMPHKFNANTMRKSIFLNNMLPFYQTEYEKKLSFGFSNYHCLNFFTSSAKHPSGVPSDSGLVFPVPTKNNKPSRFFPSSSFSYEFYVNPRYTTDYATEVNQAGETVEAVYHAGSIMHMPNCYSISLVSGSGKDSYGRVNTFRLMFQLGFDAQIPPCDIDLSVSNSARGKRKVFLSDEVLKKDHWSYCAIRWGGATHSSYTGSFVIDGIKAGEFVVDQEYSIRENFNGFTDDIPAGMVIGNRFNCGISGDGLNAYRLEAENQLVQNKTEALSSTNKYSYVNDNGVNKINVSDSTGKSFADKMGFLFDDYSSYQFGTEQLVEAFPGVSDPETYVPQFTYSGDGVTEYTTDSELLFTSPLNAELQEIRIFSRYRSKEEISSTATTGYYNFDDPNFLFYLPPFFIPSSSLRKVLETPSNSVLTSSHLPFNPLLSFGLGGRSISLENFCHDLVTGAQPRCHQLQEQEARGKFTDFAADDFDFMPATEALYLRPQNRKRNLTILPSDCGQHRPQMSMLEARVSKLTTGSSEAHYVDNNGSPFTGMINLRNLIDIKQQFSQALTEDQNTSNVDGVTESLLPPVDILVSGDGGTVVTLAANDVYGEQSNIDLVVLNRTRDTDSNEITFLDISNIFYGDLIKRESFTLRDPFVTGSHGKIQMTFKESGMGNLYRANASGSHPTWAQAGQIIYEEGLICLMDPTIPPFGIQQIATEFRGDRNIHMLEMRIPISADEALSSSNPSFQRLSPTPSPSDAETGCNLITNMFIHDENLNVIGKVNLSRPIVRKDNDRYVFRFKMDF